MAAPALIVSNAAIRTNDPNRPWVTAAAFLDDQLVALGSAAEILKLRDSRTRIVDARGKSLVLPARVQVGSRVRVVMQEDGQAVEFVSLEQGE